MTSSDNPNSGYRNALEPLVKKEVERQLQRLPPHLLKYIDPVQVIAYALNRLPALYATSVEGWDRQQQRAEAQMKEQIFKAVRQGLVAVQKDPLKVSTPLRSPNNLQAQNRDVSDDPLSSRIPQTRIEDSFLESWDSIYKKSRFRQSRL